MATKLSAKTPVLTSPSLSDYAFICKDPTGSPVSGPMALSELASLFGGGGGGTWGSITGTLADQTDLAAALVARQPLNDDLTTLAGLGAALQIPRMNAGGTAIEWVNVAAGGDVSGPASSVDNTIPRFDGATGKIIQGLTTYAPKYDDNGMITVTPSAANGETGIYHAWANGNPESVMFAVDCPSGGHSTFKFNFSDADFGQAGPNDFVFSWGVLGNGTTTETHVETREISYDPGAGYTSHEIYNTIRHVHQGGTTYWPTSRRVGPAYSTFSNNRGGAASGCVEGYFNLDFLYLTSDFANPDNPGIGTFGDYVRFVPNYQTGSVLFRMLPSTKTNNIDISLTNSAATIASDGVPLTIYSTVAGGLSLYGVGAGTLSFATSNLMSYNGDYVREQLLELRIANNVSTPRSGAGLAGGIDFNYSDPGKIAIWSPYGSELLFMANNAAPALCLDNSNRLKGIAASLMGFVSSTTLYGADVDTAWARASAGVMKCVTSSSLTPGQVLTSGLYLLHPSLTGTTTYPQHVELYRTIPAAVDDYVEIGTIAGASGAEAFRLTICAADGGNWSLSKQYLVCNKYQGVAGGAGTYKTLRPILSSTPNASNDFEVDISDSGGASFVLRIRRSSSGGSGTCPAVIRLEGLSYTQYATFTASSATGSTTAPTGFYGPVGSDVNGNPIGFGSHSAIGAETVTGFITVTDSTGVSRKLAVVS